MLSPIKKIRLIFLLIIFLPTAIFSVYEIGSFRNNEKMIEEIYNNQLDAILYSVNQNSNDVVSSWASKMDVMCNTPQIKDNEIVDKITGETAGIQALFQYDENLQALYEENIKESQKELHKLVTKAIKDSTKTIKKLKRYLEGDYRKIEPFHLGSSDVQLLVFLVSAKGKTIVNALVLNSLNFIKEVLDPKIQEIAQDKFYIGAFLNNKENIVYNSDKQKLDINYQYSKPFWFLDNYYLGIESKDKTIHELVQSRSMKNLYIILIIDFVLLIGAWMIYRNMKKQNELAQLKSDFISSVSHEIRTPLALISMYIETLELGRVKKEEKKQEYYSIIYQETQRLSSLVNKILNFSQIDNNKKKFSFSNSNLNNIVKDVVKAYKFKLDSKNFKLEQAYSEELPEINADSEAIAEVIVNLIDNSIKYSSDRKFVSIKTGLDENKVFVEVEDHGIGISEYDQKKIFEKFYRVTEKNLAHKAKGSGLGLSIVKHVMDKHKGKIEVKSKIGEGSTFRLIFPIIRN